MPVTSVHDVIHETGSTQLIALSSEEDRVAFTSNMHSRIKQIREMWFLRYAGVQACRHMGRLLAIFFLYGGRGSKQDQIFMREYYNDKKKI